VLLRAVDLRSRRVGPTQELGATPLASVSVAPGFYRIVVDGGPDGFGELAVYVRENGVYEVNISMRPTTEVVAAMVSIPGGSAIVGMAAADGFTGFQQRRVTLDAFWIDATEVTNRQYQAFVDATGHTPPLLWDGTQRSGWADLPVVGVKWDRRPGLRNLGRQAAAHGRGVGTGGAWHGRPRLPVGLRRLRVVGLGQHHCG
jgi:formylglycine-generating enzyme required for sulfatase activity